MRSQWRSFLSAAVGLVGAVSAQTGTIQDLGSLLAGQKNLTTFYSLIQKYPDILLQLPSYSGVTILAPNNDAFDKIPYTKLNEAFKNNDKDTITNVIEYHILQGTRIAAQLVPGDSVFIPTLLTSPNWSNVTGGQRVQNVKQAGDVVVFVSGQGSRSTLVQSDLRFTGGVVQVIDSLLIPPTNITQTTTAYNLTSFQGALYASSTIANITSTPNITIFAPNNAAFQALGPAISSMSVEELTSVLEYHVLPSQVVYSTALKNGSHWLTEQGSNLTVYHSGNNIYINSAQLLDSVLLSNGVLHVIDNVLNPAGPGAQPNPQLPTQVPVFASASSIASLPFTTAIPCTSDCPVTSTSGSGSGSVTGSAGARTTSAKASSTFSSSSSKAGAANVARETGIMRSGAGLMVALGGAVMML